MAELPEPLLAYFAQRETQRAEAVDAFLASLTDRERGLVHDAAVMGYVQGLMRDRSDGVPKDSQTMALVIDACLAMPDKYPTVNATPPFPMDSVWTIQTRRNGTWTRWMADRDNAAEAREDYTDVVNRSGLQWAFRLVRADTAYTTEAEHAPEADE